MTQFCLSFEARGSTGLLSDALGVPKRLNWPQRESFFRTRCNRSTSAAHQRSGVDQVLLDAGVPPFVKRYEIGTVQHANAVAVTHGSVDDKLPPLCAVIAHRGLRNLRGTGNQPPSCSRL